jgi:hypothetical protein
MFSFNRFYEQLKIVLFHGTRIHGTMLLIFLLYFLLSHFSVFNHMTLSNKDPFASFEFLTVLAAVLSSVEVFGRLRFVHSGMNYLMVPATSLEKYLAAFLYTTVGTFLVYTLSFGIIHGMVIGWHNVTSLDYIAYNFPSVVELWSVFKTLLFVQSLYFLGALVFKKSPLALTTLVIISCVLTFSFIMSWTFFHQAGFDASLHLSDNVVNMKASNSLLMFKNVFIVGSWVLPFVCWTLAYFRLKSTQI